MEKRPRFNRLVTLGRTGVHDLDRVVEDARRAIRALSILYVVSGFSRTVGTSA
jgi:hypothetical protein